MMKFEYTNLEPDDESNILDLRDMPLFFEDITDESFIPMTGPKRIDGLSQPHVSGEEDQKKQRKLPWLVLILALVLSTALGTALASRGTKVITTRPAATPSRTASQSAAPTPATQSFQVAYVNMLGALTIHGVPVFSSGNSVGAVPFGAPVTVLSEVDQLWTHISYNGIIGYVSRYYLVSSQANLTGASAPVAPVDTTVAAAQTDPQATPATDSTAPSGNGSAGGTGGSSTDTTTPTDPGTPPSTP